jgi:hypothetical protein
MFPIARTIAGSTAAVTPNGCGRGVRNPIRVSPAAPMSSSTRRARSGCISSSTRLRACEGLEAGRGYDFVQWGQDRAPRPCTRGGRTHAILLVEDATPVGAVGFEWIIWGKTPPGWHRNFAWIAEPRRRQGVLSRRWPQWLATYGEFTLEQPFSEAMANFLARRGLAVDAEELSEGTRNAAA